MPTPTLTTPRRVPYLQRVMAHSDTHQSNNGAASPQNATERPLDHTVRIVSVDENGLMEMLLKLKSSEGFLTDLAPKLGVSPQLLGDVLAGRRSFGPKLLKGMGVVRVRQNYDVEIVMDEGIDE